MKTALLMALAMSMLSAQQSVPSDPRPVLLAFGDSLTAGFGVERGGRYPDQLQARLDAAGYSYRVVNMGLAGDTTRGARTRLDRALALQPAIVILELGGNDRGSGITLEQTQTNLDAMVSLFRRAGATVVLAQSRAALSPVFTELARKHDVTLIPSFLRGVEEHPELTIGDGRHPNAEGYVIVTDGVMGAIAGLLRK